MQNASILLRVDHVHMAANSKYKEEGRWNNGHIESHLNIINIIIIIIIIERDREERC